MRRSVLITFLSIFLTIFCIVSLVFAEPQLKVAGPFKGPMVAVKKAEPPTPGRLSQTVKLTARQRGLLSASGELAIYGPHISVSREQIKEMKASRLQRGSSGSDIMKALAAKKKKMVNDRDSWWEDFYTTLTTQSEVSSAVYGNHIVAGWNDFESYYIGGDASMANWAVSHNGGKTFTDAISGLPTVLSDGPTETWGDPAIDVDSDGTFYYATMCNWNTGGNDYSGICVYNSADNGDTFSFLDCLYTTDVNDFLDKELLVVDRNNGNVYVTFTYFDDVSPFYIIYSWNVGVGWTIVESNDDGLQGSIPGVDASGNLYVAYEEWDALGYPYIKIKKSTDFGASFGSDVNVYGPFYGAADWWILGDASSFCGRDAIKGNIRSNEFPSLAIDTRTSGNGAGNLYIAFNARNPDTGNLEIYLTRFTDGGTTWSAPIVVSPRKAGDDSDKFFPWITVNGKGKIGLVYYDRKKTPGVTGIASHNWWITTNVMRFKHNLTVLDKVKVSPLFPVVVNNDYSAACYMAEYNSISANRQSADDNFYVFWGDNRYGDPDIQFSKVVPVP